MATFKLDTSTLSGGNLNFVEAILNERGRSLQITWSQTGAGKDIRLHGYAVRAIPAERVAQEPS